jgi:hypothetical protein
MLKNNSGFGKFVDVGRFGEFIAVTTQNWAHVFANNPNNVRAFGGFTFLWLRTACGKKQGNCRYQADA